MKTTESLPITLALPSNSRMAADLAPLYDALEVKPKDGSTRSPFLPNTIIRFTRGQDIIRNLTNPDGVFTFGVAGKDTAIEGAIMKMPPFALENIRSQIDTIVEFPGLGEPTSLCLLAKKEDTEQLMKGPMAKRDEPALLLTSYPCIARVLASAKIPGRVEVIRVEGGVEKALRSGDYGPNALFAVDIVRSGKTIADEGLVRIGEPLCVSSPTLFERIPRVASDNSECPKSYRTGPEDLSPNFNWRGRFLELLKKASIQTKPVYL